MKNKDKSSKLIKKLFLKRGWQILNGTVDQVTPQTTWIRTEEGNRVALAIKAEHLTRVAQVNDTIRAVIGDNEKDIVQIYSPNTREHLILRQLVAPFTYSSPGPLSPLATFGVFFTLVPVIGFMTSWLTLLVLLGNVLRSLRPMKHFGILLAITALYLGGVALAATARHGSYILYTIVFIFNCILLTWPVAHVTNEGDKADEGLAKILIQNP